MQALDVAKYHGIGNDFIIVDEANLATPMTAAWAQALCDRHRGLGADGVLVATAPGVTGRAKMTIFNADGSHAEMCGNGLRCFARWLVESGRQRGMAFVVDTDAGPRQCRVLTTPREDLAIDVEIELGEASFVRSALPMIGTGPSVETLDVQGEAIEVRGVSMGNPHAVVRVSDPDTLGQAQRLGPELSTHKAFPQGVNAGFAYVRADGSVALTVHERGCGITQACGTGAGAAIAALSLEHSDWRGTTVAVDLPGGRLHVRVEDTLEGSTKVWLTGPAAYVWVGRTRVGQG